MKFTRRRLLEYSSAGLFTALAGCASDDEVNRQTTDQGSAEPSQSTSPDSTQSETETNTTESTREAVAELGETLVYTSGDKELAFTVSQAALQDAIVTARSGRLSSTVPDNRDHTFLRLFVELENQGSERVTAPGSLVFSTDGTQYEPTYTGFTENEYESYKEILPNNRTSGWLIFSVPPQAAEGRLIVNFSNFGDAVTGEWVLNLGDLERETFDFTGKSKGDIITFGTDATQYQIGAIAVEQTQSYTYTSNDYEYEEEASEGNKFVLVTVNAENTGETSVYLPSIYDMSLRTGSSQFEPNLYLGDGAYEGGEVSTGIQREGKVLFEVPQAASSFTFQTNLTRNISASWSL